MTPETTNGQRQCTTCGVWKAFDTEHFSRSAKTNSGLAGTCRPCDSKRVAEYHRSLTLGVLRTYSGGSLVCACCGEGEADFLCLDHINGGGTLEINKFKNLYTLFVHLKNNNYPKGYQVLCHNCNNSKADSALCVHNRESQFAFLFDPTRKKRKDRPRTKGNGVVDSAGLFKRCNTCFSELEAAFSNFSKRKSGLYGLHGTCRVCHSSYRRVQGKEIRYRALVHFSPADLPECVCCGETELEFLLCRSY